jgi:glycerol-3-phosphate acyltransferase PlsY
MPIDSVLTVFAFCYLIGSFPTAYLIGRMKGINIFEVGSGNMGANNTARALGIQWGVLVWFLDGIKGIIALMVARAMVPTEHSSAAMIIGAIAVVLGHNWSIFATIMTGTIRGGKGAATASGTWVLLVPPLIIACVLITWTLIVYITRYVSLAVLTAVAVVSIAMIVLVLLDARDPIYIAYIAVTAMIFYRHRTNIRALIKGTERRLGERAS